MFEMFHNQEQSVSEWEEKDSVIYSLLSQYQRDGYNSMINIADKYSGSFLCDGVGLGKTFVGMMLIERFVKKERKNVVLIVPAAARIPVWETTIKKIYTRSSRRIFKICNNKPHRFTARKESGFDAFYCTGWRNCNNRRSTSLQKSFFKQIQKAFRNDGRRLFKTDVYAYSNSYK